MGSGLCENQTLQNLALARLWAQTLHGCFRRSKTSHLLDCGLWALQESDAPKPRTCQTVGSGLCETVGGVAQAVGSGRWRAGAASLWILDASDAPKPRTCQTVGSGLCEPVGGVAQIVGSGLWRAKYFFLVARNCPSHVSNLSNPSIPSNPRQIANGSAILLDSGRFRRSKTLHLLDCGLWALCETVGEVAQTVGSGLWRTNSFFSSGRNCPSIPTCWAVAHHFPFSHGPQRPARRSCVSSARNAGESAICPVCAQPSAEIVRVECAKCRRECDSPAARATLCGDRACRVREMQARVRFAGCARNPLRRSGVSSARNAGESAICRLCAQPSAEIARVECAKCRRECDLPAARATLCGDRACRVREMQARVRFAGCPRNPLRRSCVSSARNAGESAIRRVSAQPSAEIVHVECAKYRRECDLADACATLCGDRARRVAKCRREVWSIWGAGR